MSVERGTRDGSDVASGRVNEAGGCIFTDTRAEKAGAGDIVDVSLGRDFGVEDTMAIATSVTFDIVDHSRHRDDGSAGDTVSATV